MTEPSAGIRHCVCMFIFLQFHVFSGSDLQGIKATAVLDGDDLILNGQKTFISNGQVV